MPAMFAYLLIPAFTAALGALDPHSGIARGACLGLVAGVILLASLRR